MPRDRATFRLVVIHDSRWAEPLVLWYFKPAIVAEVGKQRAADLASYQGQWVRCNPKDGTHPGGCAGFPTQLNRYAR